MLELLRRISKEFKIWRSFIFAMWGILSVVYFYMTSKFWWGNHDWMYIKYGIKLENGFFEARYSQHLFNVLLFDGQVLPIFFMLFSFLAIVAFGFLLVYYWQLQHHKRLIIGICLFVGLNPHIFVLFFYQYLIISFTFWAVLSVVLLFFSESKKWYSILGAGLGYVVLFGGYPPILSLSLSLFCTKQLLDCIRGENSWKRSFNSGLILLIQLFIGILGYKVLYGVLEQTDMLNQKMYNLEINSVGEILFNIISLLSDALGQFMKVYPFLGGSYCSLLVCGIIAGLVLSFKDNRCSKLLFGCWMFGLFLTSQIIFVIAHQAELAEFRLAYWSKLGIYCFILMILLIQKQIVIKNFVTLWVGIVLLLFIRTDFEIQKVWCLGFDAYRKYQMRGLQQIERTPQFDRRKQYKLYTFGQAYFTPKYYHHKFEMTDKTSEMLNKHSLDFNIVSLFYWDEKYIPFKNSTVPIYDGVLKVPYGDALPENDLGFNNLEDVRKWMYFQAKEYPHPDFIYIDNDIMIVVLDKQYFYREREKILQHLVLLQRRFGS